MAFALKYVVPHLCLTTPAVAAAMAAVDPEEQRPS
jgi:hypothetical protein